MDIDRTQSLGSDEERLRAALERVGFLEWRLEQLEAQLVTERKALNQARVEKAELARSQLGWAEEQRAQKERLASALAEVALLHERLVEGDLTRQSLERRLDERGDRVADELGNLSRDLLIERQRGEVKQRALEDSRRRITELEHAQHRFYDRLVRWQDASRAGERDGLDLAELIAEMRGEILRLESRLPDHGPAPELSSSIGDLPLPPSLAPTTQQPNPPLSDFEEARRHTEALVSPTRRGHAERLIRELEQAELPLALSAAKTLVDLIGGDATPALLALLGRAKEVEAHVTVLGLLGRAGTQVALGPLERAAELSDWRLRAAALEALIKLARTTEAAEKPLHAGLSDRDPRVRRRMVLAAAAERALTAGVLAGRLESERDPATRRMIAAALRGRRESEVLRALLSALADPDEAVRSASARALFPICGGKAMAVTQQPEASRRTALALLRREILDEAPATERRERHGSRDLP